MGYTVNTHRRMNAQSLMEAQIQLSDRHRQWGDDCPMVDLDFLMCEYNHGVPVAIVDYKFHGAQLTQTSVKTYETLSGFYDKDHLQIPFMVARYWPGSWAFKLKPVNEAATAFLDRVKDGLRTAHGEWIPLEQARCWPRARRAHLGRVPPHCLNRLSENAGKRWERGKGGDGR